MGWFFNRKKTIRQAKMKEATAYNEVAKLRQETHEAAEDANKSIKKLNDLLIQNGITLRISIAAGGRHSDRH